jgi:hypothetical protein
MLKDKIQKRKSISKIDPKQRKKQLKKWGSNLM